MASEAPTPKSIVVTDDDPGQLARLTQTLRGAGYTVFALYNGIYACAQAVRVPGLDLLIANTRLAGMTITELIRQVRQAKPSLPILHLGEPLAESFLEVVNLAEPWTDEQLLDHVLKLVNRIDGHGATLAIRSASANSLANSGPASVQG